MNLILFTFKNKICSSKKNIKLVYVYLVYKKFILKLSFNIKKFYLIFLI